MTLIGLLVLVVVMVALFSVPGVPPMLRNIGAAIIFVALLFLALRLLGVVPGGTLRVR